MKKNINVVFLLAMSFSFNLMAREVIISGVITNPDIRKGVPKISIYMPGKPFLKSESNLSGLLGKGIYDTNSGSYTISVNVDDQYTGTLTVAAVQADTSLTDIETLVTQSLLLNLQSKNYTVDITLPEITTDELSFHLKLYHSGQEYDYNRPYNCIIKNNNIVNTGQIIFLSNYDYFANKNKVNNIMPGDYRVACVIKNLFGSSPGAISKVFDITLPLVDSTGSALPEPERIVNLNFDDIGGNGEEF